MGCLFKALRRLVCGAVQAHSQPQILGGEGKEQVLGQLSPHGYDYEQ